MDAIGAREGTKHPGSENATIFEREANGGPCDRSSIRTAPI
jgi:hypothetical protein